MASTKSVSPTLPKHHSELDLNLSISPSDEFELQPNRDPEPPAALLADQKLEWVSGVRLVNIVAAVTLVCFLVLLDAAVIVTAVPRITSRFHSLHDVGWYGSAYQLARYTMQASFEDWLVDMVSSATLQPLTGKVYVNFKTKVNHNVLAEYTRKHGLNFSPLVDFHGLFRHL